MWLLLCPSLSLPYSILVLLFVGLPCSYLFLWKLTPALEEPVFYALFGTAFVMVYIAYHLILAALAHVVVNQRPVAPNRLPQDARSLQRSGKKISAHA